MNRARAWRKDTTRLVFARYALPATNLRICAANGLQRTRLAFAPEVKSAHSQGVAWRNILRKYRWLPGGIIVMGILLLGILLSVAPSRKSGVVWLSPTQLAATTRPGPLAKLKSQLSRILGPLVQRLRKRDVQINFNSKVLAVSPTMLEH